LGHSCIVEFQAAFLPYLPDFFSLLLGIATPRRLHCDNSSLWLDRSIRTGDRPGRFGFFLIFKKMLGKSWVVLPEGMGRQSETFADEPMPPASPAPASGVFQENIPALVFGLTR
jgi:hypothetical protein